MRLFLASYRFGLHRERFLELNGEPGRIVVIANAVDAFPTEARASAVTSDMTLLRAAGFAPEELDLRRVRSGAEVEEVLADAGAVWVRGGNTFVLRSQMALSGADVAIRSLLEKDALVYGGYSAGSCVLGPTLRGIEHADPPEEVEPTTGGPVLWDGLGVVDDVLVPHWRSPELDPDDAGAVMVDEYRSAGTPFVTLTDDQVYLRRGDTVTVL